MTPGIHRAFAALATLAVAAAVVWGFVIAGSPDRRRQQRLDERRLDALQAIHWEIQRLVIDPEDSGRMRRPLPQTLAELAEQAKDYKIDATDPETGKTYRYRVVSETTYQLCATFALERDANREVFWNHPAGEHCYAINVLDPPR